jgi:cytochrome c oxidase assembly protein subunit 15
VAAGGVLVLLLLGQIALGGWMAANQAALACQGFPRCNGSWWPEMQLAAALPGWSVLQAGMLRCQLLRWWRCTGCTG